MRKSSIRKSIWNIAQIVLILMFCAVTVALDFACYIKFSNTLKKRLLCKIIQQISGTTAAILLMSRLNLRLFGKTRGCLYLIPCFIVAVNNFQFCSYFKGKMQLIYDNPIDIFLFASYCLSVGVFEECVFRGIIFSLLADIFPRDKKGFLLTYLVSSVIFGLVHILNGFSVDTLLQVAYSILTGGLFAFCLIKTQNIVCCAIVHGVYNFCGMLFNEFQPNGSGVGLGAGVVFDMGTVITMLIVVVLVGLFVVYKVVTYSEAERIDLYVKLGIDRENIKENR